MPGIKQFWVCIDYSNLSGSNWTEKFCLRLDLEIWKKHNQSIVDYRILSGRLIVCLEWCIGQLFVDIIDI